MATLSKHVKTTQESFEDSFAKESAKFKLTNENKIIEMKMECNLFGSILILVLQQKIDIDKILKFSLITVHLCLAQVPSNLDTPVIDGILLLRILKELPANVSKITFKEEMGIK